MNTRRVVVTGYGLATAFGDDPEFVWSQLIDGKSAIRRITNFDARELGCQIAGEITCGKAQGQIDMDSYIAEYGTHIKGMDKFIHWGLVAATQAMKHSGLAAYFEQRRKDNHALSCRKHYSIPYDKFLESAGVIIGSGIGGIGLIEDSVLKMQIKTSENLANYNAEINKWHIANPGTEIDIKFESEVFNKHIRKNPLRNPYFIVGSLINTISGFVSQKYKLKGPNQSAVTACATGAHAIADGARLIAIGDAEIMVVGGSEAAICKIAIAGFDVMKALSVRNDVPEKASSPWDKKRDGFVMGEGAGVLILEEYRHAVERGAKIYAEIIGCGTSGDAYHMSAPHPEGDGGMRAMKMAIKNSGINVWDINYMNAHGTSTPLGDMIELRAIRKLYNEKLPALKNLSISSTKSSIGHLLGAAGAVEAIFTVMAMDKSQIPPTINLDEPSDFIEKEATPDESTNIPKKVTEIFDLVPNVFKEKDIKFAMTNSFGFGGTNASLVFRKI